MCKPPKYKRTVEQLVLMIVDLELYIIQLDGAIQEQVCLLCEVQQVPHSTTQCHMVMVNVRLLILTSPGTLW